MDTSILGQAAKITLMIFMSIYLVFTVAKGDEWRDFYKNLSLRLFLIGGATLTAVIFTVAGLFELFPGVMKTSWLNLFGLEGKNMFAFGTEFKFFGVLFFLLLLLALPKLAILEEEIFREGTESWPDGILRSIIFGLTHIVVGVPLGAGLALIIGGLVFTRQYFKGGVRLAALTHFHYNVIWVILLLIITITA